MRGWRNRGYRGSSSKLEIWALLATYNLLFGWELNLNGLEHSILLPLMEASMQIGSHLIFLFVWFFNYKRNNLFECPTQFSPLCSRCLVRTDFKFMNLWTRGTTYLCRTRAKLEDFQDEEVRPWCNVPFWLFFFLQVSNRACRASVSTRWATS